MGKEKKMVGQDLMKWLDEQEEPLDLADMYYEHWRDEETEAEG